MPEENVEFGEIETVAKSFPELLDSMADMFEALGNFEEKTGKGMKEVFEPEEMKNFAEKAPPEITGSFMRLMFRLMDLSQSMEDMESLSPQEKKDLAKKMRSVSEEYKKLLKKAEEKPSNG